MATKNNSGDIESWLPGNKTMKFALQYREEEV